MNETFSTHLRRALVMLLLMTLLTGGLYPIAMTIIGESILSRQARGSLITINGKVIGSELVGQTFTTPGYFWSRPSSAGEGYNAAVSSGSNLGPINPKFLDAVADRVEAVQVGTDTRQAVPVDLVTGSGSGLDPHISPAAALYQIPRVARARGMEEQALKRLVIEHVEGRTFGFLGEPRVNVLRLNLALDERIAAQ